MAKLEFAKKHRSLFAFLCGVGSILLLMGLGSWLAESSAITVLIVASGAYILAGVAGCALIPQQPFRAARIVVFGVFVGITLHIIIFPTVNGFERNLFPLEIAAHTLWAAVFCFLLAALWRLGSRFLVSGKSGA